MGLVLFRQVINESAFSRELCLYLYKEDYRILSSQPILMEQKAKAKAFLDIYEVQEKQNSTFLEALENKSNSCSAKSTIFQDRLKLYIACTISLHCKIFQRHIKYVIHPSRCFSEWVENTGTTNYDRSTGYDTSPEQSPEYIPRLIFNQVDSNPSIAGNKHYIDSDEEDDTEEEYNANQTIIGGQDASWIFLETLEEDTAALMNKDIREEEKKMPNNIEEMIKLLFNEIISRDINTTKEKLKQKECNDSFEINFALYFSWRAQYGDTCLKANARDCNAQKEDDKHRSPGRKIDAIITLTEEDEEFSIVEVELRPNSNIRTVKLYAMQSYIYKLTIYEFRLKYSEIYTMVELLTIPIPKTWKDMKNAHDTVIGLLKYERLLNESSETIQVFLWNDDDMSKTSQKMTTRMIYSPLKCAKKSRTTTTTQ
ncbi:hypothetical protein F8M41_025089 [Gigaspora margarita]|uniref:Uncharacterized protein n=1 Tax=Gigaspora margarita TaxID=4874 RepID=A0A8H4ABC7_GIGMA|nr:hypothetical protein F8M41_025089 [Gigaspora margarita]